MDENLVILIHINSVLKVVSSRVPKTLLKVNTILKTVVKVFFLYIYSPILIGPE